MDTKDHILSVAQRLIQQRGVNGFSYADIAAEVGIRKASLHHHFATKTDLVQHLLERYRQQLEDYLAGLPDADSRVLLEQYAGLYQSNLCDQRACMGGMLAAEVMTLDPSLRPALERFVSVQERWLCGVLERGQARGEIVRSATPAQQSAMLISTLQGALLFARAGGNDAFFLESVKGVLSSLHA
ncbi:TetR/AcrR family transcriptional regulator [Methyloversatilis discipulorum]|jgi:TetR/AcrR family transcriptional regulator, transcriptional repressor for nem operon|uniref:TetR/AcrR family transcriptional regulator n=1 Tax=Methyloversatilis discipulorum TaxID=1119528 RepID=UPI001A456CD7|nr:TetR/AcrR family transcriptional regulator [Methyloversatilis discipulorum]MBL8467061.1 TetR/AcrR family transcriptional regulator [Methyloversatilis discipulorum]